MEQLTKLLILFLCVLCIRITVYAQPFNSSTDELALLSIRSRITTDPNNIIFANWSEGTSFCTWIGVTCSRTHQRVTSLNLFNMGLIGTLAPEIGNLSFLIYLDLSNNSFTGQIPDPIGNLGRLRVLEMSFNQLSGDLPWSIFNSSSLEEISFTGNELTGALPPDICSSVSILQTLQLEENGFSGDIPIGLSDCVQIRVLYLTRNNFTGNLPRDIGRLRQLEILHLQTNQLTGTIPTTIGNLSNLELLSLRSNNFEGTIPSEIGNLSNLTYLNLGANRLHGLLPPSIFNLTRLTTLSLSQNELSVNQLTGTIPPSIDTGLPNLQALYLGGNNFTGDIPISITNLSQLMILDITSNSFTSLIPINFGNLRNLQTFRLGLNHFSNNLSLPNQEFITSLTNCTNLSSFHVGVNPITGVLPRSVGNLSTSLELFLVGQCRIGGHIPSELGNLNGLVWLHLGDNQLSGNIPEEFGNLSNLQRLALYDNELEGPWPDSMCRLQSLFRVGLHRNRLSGEIPQCLGNLTSLEELYLYNNLFNSTIPSAFWSNPRIQILALFNNRLEGSLSSELANLRNLRELYLSENQFTESIPTSIGELTHLSRLEMQNNRFSGSLPSSFSNLESLQYLDLSQNNLSGSIPMSMANLTSLEYFNVSFNQLSGEIPNEGNFRNFTPSFFEGNRNLCGEPRFLVDVCPITNTPSRNRRRLLTYILPPIASIIVVAIASMILLLRYRGRKSRTKSPFDYSLELPYKRLSYNEILRATNNFGNENLIGEGGIGSVYKATFPHEIVSAVKVFNLDVQGAFKSFDTECQIMSSLRHRNLVKIITSCSNLDFKALVMEYMPNGNLDKWLHSPECSLSIGQSLDIMIDVGSAMEYLHHGYSSSIIHCDLKPSNILLDENMVARVGDFGIAKLLSEDQRIAHTKTLGTIGYMAPEYGSMGLVSTMADVYSYGILLMEIFTKKRPTDEMFVDEFSMKSWVCESFSSDVMKIVDANFFKADEKKVRAKTEECLTSVLELAMECASNLPEERPDMKDALARLQKIKISYLRKEVKEKSVSNQDKLNISTSFSSF